jgi:hypothetical protein
MSRDTTGRLYRDFYRVVVDWETRADWASVLIPLKREFFKFEKDVLQRSGENGMCDIFRLVYASSLFFLEGV